MPAEAILTAMMLSTEIIKRFKISDCMGHKPCAVFGETAQI